MKNHVLSLSLVFGVTLAIFASSHAADYLSEEMREIIEKRYRTHHAMEQASTIQYDLRYLIAQQRGRPTNGEARRSILTHYLQLPDFAKQALWDALTPVEATLLQAIIDNAGTAAP